jgi:preprotein translocase subunit SecA
LFYLSLEDDLMRMFASDRVSAIMERLKWPEGEPIEAKMVTKAVENAQKQIEERNYEIRKNVLKYDEVMNGQREVIYGERHKILEGQSLKEQTQGFVEEVVTATVDEWAPADAYPDEWDRTGLLTALGELFPVSSTEEDIAEITEQADLGQLFVQEALDAYEAKEQAVTPDVMRQLERVVLLNIIDTKWREHLYEMDYLQEGIHLRAYAQRDPLVEYQREAFAMFEALTASIREDFVKYIYRVELVQQERTPRAPKVQRLQENRDEVLSGAAGEGGGGSKGPQAGNPDQAISDKTPRNAPCPCGSGLKYKKCHGAAA